MRQKLLFDELRGSHQPQIKPPNTVPVAGGVAQQSHLLARQAQRVRASSPETSPTIVESQPVPPPQIATTAERSSQIPSRVQQEFHARNQTAPEAMRQVLTQTEAIYDRVKTVSPSLMDINRRLKAQEEITQGIHTDLRILNQHLLSNIKMLLTLQKHHSEQLDGIAPRRAKSKPSSTPITLSYKDRRIDLRLPAIAAVAVAGIALVFAIASISMLVVLSLQSHNTSIPQTPHSKRG